MKPKSSFDKYNGITMKHWYIDTEMDIPLYTDSIIKACGFKKGSDFLLYLRVNFNCFSTGLFLREDDCKRAIDWIEPQVLMYKLSN
jgi:hypothetical protein